MDQVAETFHHLIKKRYNRDAPYLPNKLIELLTLFIKNSEPIRIVGFWGVGPKNKYNWAEQDACKLLSKLNDGLKAIYPPGIIFTFIFSEEHGIHNGITFAKIKLYTKSVEKLFNDYDFKFIHLKPLWRKYKISFDKINEIYNKGTNDWWLNFHLSGLLEKLAAKRNCRLEAIEAAQKYAIMRILEKEMLEKEFNDSIFLTYSGPEFDALLPNMPRLYFYSYKKGRSDSPWFVTE